MARADLLKKLFETYQRRDDEGFRAAAREIVEEERKKQHPVLASELQRILTNGVRSMQGVRRADSAFDSVPMDGDRRTPLIAIRQPDRYLDDLVLSDETQDALRRIMVEVRGWEILDAHGLAPTRRVLFCGPSGCGKTRAPRRSPARSGCPCSTSDSTALFPPSWGPPRTTFARCSTTPPGDNGSCSSTSSTPSDARGRRHRARPRSTGREYVPTASRWVRRAVHCYCGD